jgi:hypothetical protein
MPKTKRNVFFLARFQIERYPNHVPLSSGRGRFVCWRIDYDRGSVTKCHLAMVLVETIGVQKLQYCKGCQART